MKWLWTAVAIGAVVVLLMSEAPTYSQGKGGGGPKGGGPKGGSPMGGGPKGVSPKGGGQHGGSAGHGSHHPGNSTAAQARVRNASRSWKSRAYRSAKGYYWFRHRPSDWRYRRWHSQYRCYCWWDPVTEAYYYWCGPYNSYFPVTYCPTGTYNYNEPQNQSPTQEPSYGGS